MTVARSLEAPKLLYQVIIDRSHYRKRSRFLLVIIIVSAGAWFALNQEQTLRAADSRAVSIGALAAAAIILLASIRLVINLVRWRNRPSETLRMFNKGFSWTRGDQKQQYGWANVQIFREGGHGLYLGKRALLQWGSHRLLMGDKQTFVLLPRHGNLRRMARIIRPHVGEYVGIRMARRLREEKPIRIHPKIIVWPGGLQVGKAEYPWEQLKVGLKGQRLVIQAREKGKYHVVGRYSIGSIDNLGGFLELAQTTIRTHRERPT